MLLLSLTLLFAGCKDDDEEKGGSHDTEDTEDSGGVLCDADMDAALVALNVADAYDTGQDPLVGEPIKTEFSCVENEEGCTDAPCVDMNTACEAGDVTIPYGDEPSLLTCESGVLTAGGGDLEVGLAAVLAAKLAEVERTGLYASGYDFCAEDASVPVCQTFVSVAGGAFIPPPPTGSCPSLADPSNPSSCVSGLSSSTTAVFDFTVDPGTPEYSLNLAQVSLNASSCGCWIRATPKSSVSTSQVWFATVYGMVNYGTSAVVHFVPCDSSSGTAVDLAVYKLRIAIAPYSGTTAQFVGWLDDPATITTTPGAQISVVEIEFTQGPNRYRYQASSSSPWSKWSYTGRSWTSGSSPSWAASSCSSPFAIASGTGPYSILDPAGPAEALILDAAAEAAARTDVIVDFGEPAD